MSRDVEKRPGWIEWDNKRILDEVIEYRMGDTTVFTRRRCPVINSTTGWRKTRGLRCSMQVGEGYQTCRNHRGGQSEP
jgi:hypothetical protein